MNTFLCISYKTYDAKSTLPQKVANGKIEKFEVNYNDVLENSEVIESDFNALLFILNFECRIWL